MVVRQFPEVALGSDYDPERAPPRGRGHVSGWGRRFMRPYAASDVTGAVTTAVIRHAIGGSELPSTSLGQIRRALDTVHGVLQTVNMALRGQHLSSVVAVGPRAEAFLIRTDSLVT